MSQVLDAELQHCVMNAIAHEACMAKVAIQEAAGAYQRPSVLFRPSLSVDGSQWCALYGDNLQDGVAGFGDSPADAMWDFDRAWSAKLNPQQARSKADEVLRAHGFPELRAG